MSALGDVVTPRLDAVPAGPAWLADVRRTGIAQFRAHGFPTTKTEAWRFTSVRGITGTAFGDGPEHAGAHPVRVPSGVTLERASAPADAASVLGHVAPVTPFTSLNAAMFRDVLLVRIAQGASVPEPIEIDVVHPSGDSPAMCHPRIVVVVPEGAHATLVERHRFAGAGPHFVNAVVEIDLASGASLEHLRVHDGTPGSFTVQATAVRQASSSRYVSRCFSFGGGLGRLEITCSLEGPGAECALDGLYLVGGADQVDHFTEVRHLATDGTSQQTYKGIVTDRGHAVFDGTVVVARDAQRTSARQKNDNLILSDEAVVNTKPHLEIDADDVVCSHGATVGRLDDDQIFYLRARGLDEPSARTLLVRAFARSLVERVALAELRDEIGALVDARMARGGAA